jgi:hypothetical protein
MDITFVTTNPNIRLPEQLLAEVEAAARAPGKSVDELAEQAMKRELARLFWEKNKRESIFRRGNKTDEQLEDIVNSAIAEIRRGR